MYRGRRGLLGRLGFCLRHRWFLPDGRLGNRLRHGWWRKRRLGLGGSRGLRASATLRTTGGRRRRFRGHSGFFREADRTRAIDDELGLAGVARDLSLATGDGRRAHEDRLVTACARYEHGPTTAPRSVSQRQSSPTIYHGTSKTNDAAVGPSITSPRRRRRTSRSAAPPHVERGRPSKRNGRSRMRDRPARGSSSRPRRSRRWSPSPDRERRPPDAGRRVKDPEPRRGGSPGATRTGSRAADDYDGFDGCIETGA